MPKPFEFPTPSSYQTPHEFANGLEKRSEDNEWIGTPGIYTNYLRGLCDGRDWEYERHYIRDGRAWVCRLTVTRSAEDLLKPKPTGSKIFKEPFMQSRGREFLSEARNSPEAAFEDAARKAHGLLHDLTHNLDREKLPSCYDAREQQGRGSYWGSRASSDPDSSDSSSSGSKSGRSQEQYRMRH